MCSVVPSGCARTGTGGLIGGLYDLDQADLVDQTLAQVCQHIPPGHNALLAEVDEYAVDVDDSAIAAQAGTVLRRSADDVLAEIEAAEAAAEEAQRQARRRRANARRRNCTTSTRTERAISAKSCTSVEPRWKRLVVRLSESHYQRLARERPRSEPRVGAGIDPGHLGAP